jgi:hypothetical protein
MPSENRLHPTRKSLPEIWLVLIRLKLARLRLALHRRQRARSWRVISLRNNIKDFYLIHYPIAARPVDLVSSIPDGSFSNN